MRRRRLGRRRRCRRSTRRIACWPVPLCVRNSTKGSHRPGQSARRRSRRAQPRKAQSTWLPCCSSPNGNGFTTRCTRGPTFRTKSWKEPSRRMRPVLHRKRSLCSWTTHCSGVPGKACWWRPTDCTASRNWRAPDTSRSIRSPKWRQGPTAGSWLTVANSSKPI